MSLFQRSQLTNTQAKSSPVFEEQSAFASPISPEEFKQLKMKASFNEVSAFISILKLIGDDLSAQEKQIIQDELDNKNNMVLMIFRFYLQANEYGFFIRRLKNVAMTKISLTQVKTHEETLKRSSHLFSSQKEPPLSKRLSDTVVSQSKKYITPKKEPVAHSSSKPPMDRTQNYQHSEFQLSTQKQFDTRFKDKRPSDQFRPALAPKLRVEGTPLDDRDYFRFRTQKCIKASSPRTSCNPKIASIDQAARCLMDLGLDCSFLKTVPDQDPNLSLQVKSECELSQAEVSKNSPGGSDLHSKINNLVVTMPSHQVNCSEVFDALDYQYIVNILRHQGTRKDNLVSEEDMVVCLQIVTRNKGLSTEIIQKEVKKLFEEVGKVVEQPDSLKVMVRGTPYSQKELSLEALVTPIILKCHEGKPELKVEVLLQKCFECFRLQFGLKLVKLQSLKEFLNSTLNYTQATRSEMLPSQLFSLLEKLSSDLLLSKGMQFETRVKIEHIREFLQQSSIPISQPKRPQSGFITPNKFTIEGRKFERDEGMSQVLTQALESYSKNTIDSRDPGKLGSGFYSFDQQLQQMERGNLSYHPLKVNRDPLSRQNITGSTSQHTSFLDRQQLEMEERRYLQDGAIHQRECRYEGRSKPLYETNSSYYLQRPLNSGVEQQRSSMGFNPERELNYAKKDPNIGGSYQRTGLSTNFQPRSVQNTPPTGKYKFESYI